MTQHGEGEARFSSGGTASVVATGTRLSRPDEFDGCYDCALRDGNKCPEHLEGIPSREMGPCEEWKPRNC
jgi:hypothetical protein